MADTSRFSGMNRDVLRNRLEFLRQQAYVYQKRNLSYTGFQAEFQEISDYLASQGEPPMGWDAYVEESPQKPIYEEYDPSAQETMRSPIYAVDFETASRVPGFVNPIVDYPLSLTWQELRWNPRGTKFQKAGGKKGGWSVLIRPRDPETNEPLTNRQIESLLAQEIDPKQRPGVTLGKVSPSGESLTNISIEQYENPEAHGYIGVYTPEQLGTFINKRIQGQIKREKSDTIQPPIFLGKNVEAFDIIHLNRILGSAGENPVFTYNAQIADVQPLAVAAGIPYGSRSLEKIYDYMNLEFPGTPHTPADVPATYELYPKLMEVLRGTRELPKTPVYPPPAQIGGAGEPPVPPQRPTAQETSPQGMGVNPFRKKSLEDFKAEVSRHLQQRLGENTQIRFRDIKDDITRLSVTPEGFEKSLVLDLAPGYETSLGPSLELVSSSKWRGLIGPEAIVKTEEEVQLRSPMEAFSEYVAGTFSKGLQALYKNKDPRTIFMYLMNLGMKISPRGYEVAGGPMWAGPPHTERAVAEMAGRVNIALGPDVKDYDKATQMIYNRIDAARRAETAQADESLQLEKWKNLYGHIITTETGGRLRTRAFGMLGPEDKLYLPRETDLSKAIKRMNIDIDVRERATMERINPKTGMVETALPEPISATERGWKGQAGYRLLGGSMPGERERYVALTIPHMAVMNAPVFPGAAMIYNPETFGEYFSAGYETIIEPDIPQLTMQQLANAEWEWGRFRQVKGEEGEISYRRMKEGQNVIGAGETAIIGLLNYPKEIGGERTTTPIKIATSGRPLYLGQPQLKIPIEFSMATGYGTAGLPVEGQPKDVTPSSLYLEEIQKRFGGEVGYSVGGPGAEGMSALQVPVRIGTALSGKGPYKVTFMPTPTPFGEQVKNVVDIGLSSGDLIRRQISGLTGDLKSWQRAFAGHFLAMTPEQRRMMLGEFYDVNPEMALEMQAYQLARAQEKETVMFRGKPIETYGGVSSEALGKIYARHMGLEYQWETSATQMYGHLRQLVEALPIEQQVQRYEYAGNLGEQSYYMGLFPESTKKAMQLRAYRAAVTTMQQDYGIDVRTAKGMWRFKEEVYPGGMKSFLDDLFKFEKVNLTPTPIPPTQRASDLSVQATRDHQAGTKFDYFLQAQARKLEPTGRTTAAARRVAGGYGIQDISGIPGTGAQGRVLRGDVEQWVQSQRPRYEEYRQSEIERLQRENQLPTEQMYAGFVSGPAAMLTFTAPPVPEHMAQLPRMGYEEIAALWTAAPDLAKYLGLGLNEIGGAQETGFYPSHARAWREIGDIAAFTASGRTLPYTEEGKKGYVELTPEIRDIIQVAAGQVKTIDELEELLAPFGEGPLYNPETNILFPRPGTISDISKYAYEQGMDVLEPVASSARMYMRAVQQWAFGLKPGDENTGALTGVLGMAEDVFRSGGKSVEKTLAARFIPQQITARFGAISGTPLGYGSGVMPLGTLETALKQMARAEKIDPTIMVENPANPGEEMRWIELAKRQITERGHILAGGSRYPVFQREGGSALIPLLTEEILKRQGIQFPTGSTVRGSNVVPGNIMTTGYSSMVDYYLALLQQGDWDADPITQFLAAKATPKGLEFFTGQEAINEMGRTGIERFRRELRLEKLGHLETFNALEKEVQGIIRQKLGQPTGKEAGIPGTPTLKEIPYEDAFREAMAIRKTVSGMGVAYNARRLLEASATALGWNPEAISKGQTQGAQFYQRYLDKLTHYVKEIQSGGFSNIETLLSTGTFQNIPAVNEAQLKFKAGEGEKWGTWWSTVLGQNLPSDQLSQLFSRSIGVNLIEAVAGDIATMEGEPSYEFASYLLATSEEDVPMLAERMREFAKTGLSPKEAVTATLWGKGLAGPSILPAPGAYYQEHDVTKSPLGLAALTAATGRLVGWQNRPPKYVDVQTEKGTDRERLLKLINSQMISFQGETTSIGRLSQQPALRRASALYGWMTGNYGTGDITGKMTYAPLRPESTVDLLNFKEELVSQGKTPPFLLDYVLSQERAIAKRESMRFSEPRFLQNITTEQAQRWVAPQLYMGSSTLPFFAMETNYGYGPPESEQEWRKARMREFVASNMFGLPQEAVTRIDPAELENMMTGSEVEQKVAPEIAKRFNMFKYETRQTPTGEVQVPIVGPIYGIEHEEYPGQRPAEWVPARTMLTEGRETLLPEGMQDVGRSTLVHVAPDIAGPMFSPQTGDPMGYLLGEIKWSGAEATAAMKPYSAGYKIQVGQQYQTLYGLGANPNIKQHHLTTESLIRGTPWFQEYWSTEALKEAGITDPAKILSEQERAIRENVRIHRQAITRTPIQASMFAFHGPAGAPMPVGTLEQQLLGFKYGGLGSFEMTLGIMKGIQAGEALNEPEEIIRMRGEIHSEAFAAGLDTRLLGSEFMGLEPEGAEPKQFTGRIPKSQRVVPGTLPGTVGTSSISKRGVFSGPLADLLRTQVPPTEPLKDLPTTELKETTQRDVERIKKGDVIPMGTITPEGEIEPPDRYIDIKTLQRFPWLQELLARGTGGGAGEAGTSGEGQDINIRYSQYGIGADPTKAALNVSKGLTSALGMYQPGFVGGTFGEEKIMSFEQRMTRDLGEMLGMTYEQAQGVPFQELLVEATTRHGHTRKYKNVMLRERAWIEEAGASYRRLESGWQWGKRLSISPEMKAQVGALLGKGQDDLLSQMGMTYKGLPGGTETGKDYESLSRNLLAAAQVKSATDDWKTFRGGSGTLTTEELKEFMERLRDSNDLLGKFNKQLEDTNISAQKRAELETRAQRVDLLQQREMARVEAKQYEAQIRAFQEEGIEGATPGDVARAIKGAPAARMRVRALDERIDRLTEVAEEFRTGERRPESGIGRFLRRSLGGFGLMYLGTLGRYITGGWGYGQEQRLGLDELIMQQTAAGTGAAYFMPNQQRAIATQMAVQGATYNPLQLAQYIGTQAPIAREAFGALGAGMGTYAGLMWYGGFAPQDSLLRVLSEGGTYRAGQTGLMGRITGGRGIGLTAGRIAGAAAIAQIGGQIIANMQDEEGLAYGMGARGMQGGWKGFWEGFSLRGASEAIQWLTNQEYRESTTEFSNITRALQSGSTDLWQQIGGQAPADQARMLARTMRVAVGEYPEFAPEVITQVMQTMYRGRIAPTKENINMLAGQLTSGIANEPLVNQMLGALGYSPSKQYAPTYTLGRFGERVESNLLGQTIMALSGRELNPQLQAQMVEGATFAQQLGAATYYLPGLGAGTGVQTGTEEWANRMVAQFQEWSNVVGTPMEPLAVARYQNWYRSLQAGIQVPEPEMPSIKMAPQQLRAAELQAAMEAIPLDIQEQYEETMGQALSPMISGGTIQRWIQESGFQRMTRGEQLAETERMGQIGQIRLMRERYGEGFTPRDMGRLLQMTRGEITREYAQWEQYGETREQLQTLGYGEGFAGDIAGRLRAVQQQGPQGEMIAQQTRGQLAQAAYLGIDLTQFVDQLTAGVQEAVVGGMALGIAQTAAGVGFNAQDIFGFASQGLQQATQAQMGVGLAQRIIGVTGREQAGRRIGDLAMDMGNMEQAQFLERLFSFEPIAMTQAAQAGIAPNWMATTNITLGGAVTGQPLFTSSMMQGRMNMGAAVLGPLAQTQAGQAAQYGINVLTGQVYSNQQEYQAAAEAMRQQGYDPNQFIQGGQRALSWLQMLRGFQYQQAQAGIGLAQIALQEKYQPLFWGIEDRQRALQDRQAQWGFEMQERQMQMQRSQFFENIGFQQQQAGMQRQWTMQDWLYQDQMRNMQWGWRQEDFAENVRFMTGRQRKLAERQMERETIMFGMEGDRITQQRDRQKELWALEDQRFEMTKRHFLEQFQLQEENLEKQKQFYDEGKRLREEQVKLQRAYWRENIELQKQAAAASASYAKDMQEIQKAMTLIGQAQGDYTDRVQVATTNEVKMINTLIDGTNWYIQKAPDAIRSILAGVLGGRTSTIPQFGGGGGGGGSTGKGDKTPTMRASGGPSFGYTIVGEGGPEMLETTIPAHIMPNSELKAMAYGQESNFNSYWNNTYIDMPGNVGTAEPTVVNVFLGNEKLGRFVLDAVKNDLEVG